MLWDRAADFEDGKSWGRLGISDGSRPPRCEPCGGALHRQGPRCWCVGLGAIFKDFCCKHVHDVFKKRTIGANLQHAKVPGTPCYTVLDETMLMPDFRVPTRCVGLGKRSWLSHPRVIGKLSYWSYWLVWFSFLNETGSLSPQLYGM